MLLLLPGARNLSETKQSLYHEHKRGVQVHGVTTGASKGKIFNIYALPESHQVSSIPMGRAKLGCTACKHIPVDTQVHICLYTVYLYMPVCMHHL